MFILKEREVLLVESNLFNSKIEFINENIEIHFLNIKELNIQFIEYINENIVSICKGINNKSSLEVIKKRIVRFFEKKDERARNGATAEFFLHLYLRNLDYKQECMFFNMEENSPKKGFDGYYSKNNEDWIMESKSGNAKHINVTHPNKIKEAYNNLKEQLSGRTSNDPWQNAFQHANSRDVGTEESILETLRRFSDDYICEIYYSPEQFNIIPASTIFLNGVWEDVDSETVYKKLMQIIPSFKHKKLLIICCTKKTLDLFIDYLGISKGEENNEQQRKETANFN